MNLPINSIKHVREKLHQFSTISFRGQKQREYFLTYSMRPELSYHPSQTGIVRI